MEEVVSFAQEYEDIILYHMLKNVGEPIRYIDVGANDPIFLSVTKFFSLRGGSGLNIEPQHDLIERLNVDRPKDVNLEVGVSNQKGTLKLYGTGPGASFNEKLNPEGAVQEVPILTLNDILSEYGEKQEYHFLKIDVEGFEKQVLEGMNFAVFRPWIICIESTESGSEVPSWDVWESILLSQEYDFVGMEGINRYYTAKESKTKLNDFCDIDHLQSFYEIYYVSPHSKRMDAKALLKMKRKCRHFKRAVIGLLVALIFAIFYILTHYCF